MRPTDIAQDVLNQLVPLSALNSGNRHALLAKAIVLTPLAGEVVFSAGDDDGRSLYLIAGELILKRKGSADRKIESGTPEADHPIDPDSPRSWQARAVTDCQLLSIDAKTMDIMLTWDQEASAYDVVDVTDDINDEQDWMMRMLSNQAFYEVPPANIHAVFTRMQSVGVKAGDVVIRQGQPGDFFYAVQEGRCNVIRETPRQPNGIKLAELGPGDSFGEEALLSNAPRNATVTMLTDGELMRLAKADFDSLLKAPSIETLNLEQARKKTTEGARWLDVRLPSEFAKARVKGALNVPLFYLRKKSAELDPDVPYIVYCDSGRRSSAGAYLLKERGFEAYVLEGGLAGASKRASD
ncbi:MAG: cyclic nucleotide-binding domain-containing protein [Gammaproteobacteria bacterium]|nr:cyclic nucleotide-binding domain-containing protein [Gammaproteobacteria bacterium]MCP5135294.1 cyclic nucleotide-binding domain-containing protein [Gammaproteobacteria bacterium]